MSYWTRRAKLGKMDASKYTDNPDARQGRQLSEFCNQLPDDPNKPGYKKSPIPVYGGTIGPVDRTKYSVQNVQVKDLKTRQPHVNAHKIKNFDPTKLPNDDTRHPLVVVTRDNQLVVDNGNHRVVHMLASGVHHTKARIVHEIHGYGQQGVGSIP